MAIDASSLSNSEIQKIQNYIILVLLSGALETTYGFLSDFRLFIGNLILSHYLF